MPLLLQCQNCDFTWTDGKFEVEMGYEIQGVISSITLSAVPPDTITLGYPKWCRKCRVDRTDPTEPPVELPKKYPMPF